MNILKLLKQNLNRVLFKKFTAIFTALTFVFTMVCSQSVYALMPSNSFSVQININDVSKNIIPFNLGRITDAYYANSEDVVISIQDLHSHEQTQRNISSILSVLDKTFGISDIYIEGATGTIDTKWLSDIKDPVTKQQIIDTLLRTGRLTGGELFSVNSNKTTILKGLENKEVYLDNFKRLNNIYNKQEEIKIYIDILNGVFDKKSEKYYSKNNKNLNKVVNSYRTGKIRTDKYIEYLLKQTQKTNINLTKYKNIINFTKILSKQKFFDSKSLSKEVKSLLIELKEKMQFSEYKGLVEKSTKKEYEIDFYFDLLKKAQEFNLLKENKYKNTSSFFEYLVLNQKLNTVDLANEEKIFVKELNNKFSTTESEKEIYFLKNYLESLSHYLTNKITAKEYDYFVQNMDKFKLLWKKYIDIDNIIDITEYFNLVEDFYKNNVERNRIFIKNLFGKPPKQASDNVLRIKNSTINHKEKIAQDILNGKIKKVHVVITGGFHTYGFNKMLEEENCNYLVITPNITSDTSKAELLYEAVFKEQFDITNTTFSNMPITQLIKILNKGEIKTVRKNGNDLELEYVSGEIVPLKSIAKDNIEDTLSQDQAKVVSNTVFSVIATQDLLKTIREDTRKNVQDISEDKRVKEQFQKLESLIEQIDNAEIKNIFVSIKDKISEDIGMYDDTDQQLMLPVTKRLLNSLFWFVKRKSVKDRIMSVGAAILENTFLFPIILFAPETFVLMHYPESQRKIIKKYFGKLEEKLEELKSKQKKNKKDFEEINLLESFMQRLEGTRNMRDSGIIGLLLTAFLIVLGIVGTIQFSESIRSVLVTVFDNMQYLFYALVGSFAFGFFGSHMKYNLKIDSKISKAKNNLRDSIFDLFENLPNDIYYENIHNSNTNFPFIYEYVETAFGKNFFKKYYIKSMEKTREPLMMFEILKGIKERGADIDYDEYNKNIEVMVDYIANMKLQDKKLFIKYIDKELKENPYLSKKERAFLIKFRNNIKNIAIATSYKKLSIAESRKEEQKSEVKKEFQRPKYIFLLGGPGSGKGTLAVIIEDKYNGVRRFSMGDALRKIAKTDHPEIQEMLDNGILVPVPLTMEAAEDELNNYRDYTLIFDGFPRQKEQANKLFKILEESGKHDDIIIINLDVPLEEVLNRFSGRRSCPDCGHSYNIDNKEYAPLKKDGKYYCKHCYDEKGELVEIVQRPDDTPDSIRERYSIYEKNSKGELIPLYESLGLHVYNVKNAEESLAVINFYYLMERLTDSKEDVELKENCKKMIDAGFSVENIVKLLSQYLSLRNGEIPQELYSKTSIKKFGTAGVRGVMGEEVDFLDVAIITQAISNVISEIAKTQNISEKDIKIFLGRDTRFLSKQFVEIVSKIFAKNEKIEVVVVSKEEIPTPTVSWYTRENKFTLSVNITASHNPMEFTGYKITLGDGGQAGTNITKMIEEQIKIIRDNIISNKQNIINITKDSSKIKYVDVKPKFIDALLKMIITVFNISTDKGLDKFRKKAAKWTIVMDPKNGATRNYYKEILKFFGFNVKMINDNIDPTFGGIKPEPSFESSQELVGMVEREIAKGNKKCIGVLTDPDGDRFGFVAAINGKAQFISGDNNAVILLNVRLRNLFDKLITELNEANGNLEKQNSILEEFLSKKTIIARNNVTTVMIDDLTKQIVSEYYDKLKEMKLDSDLLKNFKKSVEIKQLKVGFKYVAQTKHEAEDNGDRFLLGVESSGGVSIGEWIYDKCGFLANLMLLFNVVNNNRQPDIYNLNLIETAIRFRDIVKEEGKLDTQEEINKEANKRQTELYRTIYTILAKNYKKTEKLKNLFTEISPELKIKEIKEHGGIRITFENGTWIQIRQSGTEPILRVFVETKGDRKLVEQLVDFIIEKNGQVFVDKINNAFEQYSKTLLANKELFKKVISETIEPLQGLTYSILYKDNMEYTIVAQSDDFARIKLAQTLSQKGIKVNLILIGENSLVKETDSRISTDNGDLAFCLMDTPNSNLTVYGYDDKFVGQTIAIDNVSQQDAIISMLKYVNNISDKSIKLLDLPENLKEDIKISDVEEKSKDLFSVIGVGKSTMSLFVEALKNKFRRTDDMIIKPSLVASNLSAEQIDNFGQENINRLMEQGITTIIISADDDLLKDKSNKLKDLLQIAHNNGLKVMFNYKISLKHQSVSSVSNWISSFDDRFNMFKENGGIDGLQIDLSDNGEIANEMKILLQFTVLSQKVSEQNVGSFLSIRMPSEINPSEYSKIFKDFNIKLVADYNSSNISQGISLLNAENMIINISADTNGSISMSQLSNIFENNKVSMISFDLSILEAIDTTDDFSFNGMTITKFITSIFETTPEGQIMKGINRGREFIRNRGTILNEDIEVELCKMYDDDQVFDIKTVSRLVGTRFRDNLSSYELKGFVIGIIQATELGKVNAEDISFTNNNQEYRNLLMQTLFEYIKNTNESFSQRSNAVDDIETVLAVDKFSSDIQPKIIEIHNILNGAFENKIDSIISILASLKDNPKLSIQERQQERQIVLEGLLLFLLGYARQDVIDMGSLTSEENIANIKAILRAA